MTKIKFCGLTRPCDIEAANQLRPDYIGFVFAPGSKRYVSPAQAAVLKKLLHPSIAAVGVFVQEEPELIASLLEKEIIDLAQLHGQEDETYIRRLRELTDKPIIQAFHITKAPHCASALAPALRSSADYILLDSGNGGTGTTFDWSVLQNINRPYFLAGGLNPENAGDAVRQFHPFALDVSSGIETDGMKDSEKMTTFINSIRKEKTL